MRVPDKTLDIQGIAGPRARTIAKETLQLMARGHVLKLIASGRDAQQAIAQLCGEEGYELLEQSYNGAYVSIILLR